MALGPLPLLLLLLAASAAATGDQFGDCTDENADAYCAYDSFSKLSPEFFEDGGYGRLAAHRVSKPLVGNKMRVDALRTFMATTPEATAKFKLAYARPDAEKNCVNNGMFALGSQKSLSSAEITDELSVDKDRPTLVTVTDPACVMQFDWSANDKIAPYAVYPAGIEYEKFNHASNNDRVLRKPMFPHEKDALADSNRISFFGAYEKVDSGQWKKKKCYGECKYGRIIAFNGVGANQPFTVELKLNSNCSWMRLDLSMTKSGSPPRFSQYDNALISIQNGFVVMPKEVRATVHNFRRNGRESTEPISIGLHYETQQALGLVHIITEDMDRVTKMDVSHSDIVAFTFSSPYCLAEPIKPINGMDTDGTGDVPSTDGDSYVLESDPEDVTEYHPTTASPKPDNPDVTTSPTAATAGTTTPAAVDPDATTKRPELAPTFDEQTYSQLLNEILALENKVDKWRWWAIPVGFAVGSIIAYIIGAIVMAIFSRSFYTPWYREMYRRYGSENSEEAGTTMGDTEMGDTVGSATTMAGGSTTMGATTTDAGGATEGASETEASRMSSNEKQSRRKSGGHSSGGTSGAGRDENADQVSLTGGTGMTTIQA